MSKKRETLEQRSTRMGGENEVAGSESAARAKQKMQQMDRQPKRPPKRQPKR